MSDRLGHIPTWEIWDGEGFPGSSFNATVYFALGAVDLEDSGVRKALATKLREDGVAATVFEGLGLLESAVVVHGQVRRSEGELYPWHGVASWDDEVDDKTLTATWVEIGDLS